jgi:formate dehydrogenase iron-sulfur subunit
MIAHANHFRSSSPAPADDLVDSGDIINTFLAEQKKIGTAVSRFSQWHDKTGHHTQAQKSYQDLIPLTRPTAGEQYAFEVDLDTCSGCKACVVACHNLNGLDELETWRDIGSLHHPNPQFAHQQTVTTACHHCADPACSNGCPVLAYDKDEETGIVRHLDDQCIGCQYCVLKCPYDVPKYNEQLGIVRKCDMCHSRLSLGEAPACVQACPNEAIRIIKVKTEDLFFQPGEKLLPGVFDSEYTRPTTRYLTKNQQAAQMKPADASLLRVEHTHVPLVAMLVLTQSAAGTVWAQTLLLLHPGPFQLNLTLSFFALLTAILGLSASILHLGRPLQAWRAFLGWKKSWLSREILAFGPWFGAVATLFILSFDPISYLPPAWQTHLSTLPFYHLHLPALALATSFLGLVAVFCSIMVYVDTRRPFWSLPRTSLRFLGTCAIIGSSVATFATGSLAFAIACALFTLLKTGTEAQFLYQNFSTDPQLPDTKSARVTCTLLTPWLQFRMAASLLGALLLFFFPALGCLLLLSAEFAERVLFFRAVTAPRMPGKLH